MKQVVQIVLGLLLTIVGASFLKTAITVLLVMPPRLVASVRISPPSNHRSDQRDLASETARLRSPGILVQVITNLDLNTRWGQKFHESSLHPELTLQMLQKAIQAEVEPRMNQLLLKVTGEDGAEAAAIANEIARVYCSTTISSSGDTNRAASIVALAPPTTEPAPPTKLTRLMRIVGIVTVLEVGGVSLIILGFRKRRTPPPPLPTPDEP